MKRLLTISILVTTLASATVATHALGETRGNNSIPKVLVANDASSFTLGTVQVAAYLMQTLIGTKGVSFQGIDVGPEGTISIRFGQPLAPGQIKDVKEAAASLIRIANQEAKTEVLYYVAGKEKVLFYIYAADPTQGNNGVAKIAATLDGSKIILNKVTADANDHNVTKLMKAKEVAAKKSEVANPKLLG